MESGNNEQRPIIAQSLTALEDRDWNTRATAVRMLGELGDPSLIEPLVAALHDADESVRAAAVRALGKLGEHAPVDLLVAMLSDPSWMVREMAVLTLGELGERAPTEALMNILHAEHEDVFVREAAKMALQQSSSLTQHAASAGPAQDCYPEKTYEHSPSKTSLARLNGLTQRFTRRPTARQEKGDLVEIADLDNAASTSLPLPLPVRSRRSLPLRIAEGVLVALLLLGLGLSWLLLTQKLHQSSRTGTGSTPTTSTGVSPSGPDSTMSLAVVDGTVDVGTANSGVYALRASDGSLLWHYNTAGPVPGPDSPPVGSDGIIYVSADVDQGFGNTTGYIYALRGSDGALLWRYTTDGYVYTPTVAGGVVYVGSMAGSLAALRASDDTLLWRYTAEGSMATPVVVNGIVYVDIDQSPDNPNYLYALRASDGKFLWRTPSYAYAPVIVNGVVYITSQAGLSALRASNGAQLWRYALAGTDFSGFSGPTIVDGVLYAVATKYPPPDTSTPTPTAGGPRLATAPLNWNMPFKQEGPSSLYALRASNGTVLWHYETPGNKNNGMGVLAVAGGMVYIDTAIGSSKTTISALRASDGSLLWTHAGDGSLEDWAIVGQGIIYLPSNPGEVYALQARDGKELWHYAISGNVYSSPVLNGSTLFIGADNGVIYALNASNGSLLWHYVTQSGS